MRRLGSMLFIALCLGRSAGFVTQRVVASPACARSIKPARMEAVVLVEWSEPTLRSLWGLLALTPLGVLNSTWSTSEATRLKEIKAKKLKAATAETALGLFRSTAFLTSVYELQYAANNDAELRVASAVVVAAAITGATKAAFLADNATREAGEKKKKNEKYIPLVAVVLGFVLQVTAKGLD